MTDTRQNPRNRVSKGASKKINLASKNYYELLSEDQEPIVPVESPTPAYSPGLAGSEDYRGIFSRTRYGSANRLSKKVRDKSNLQYDASEKESGESKTLRLRESSNNKPRDPKMKEASELLKYLSLDSVASATEEKKGEKRGEKKEEKNLIRETNKAKEKLRVKQQQRRQRNRAKKRDNSKQPSDSKVEVNLKEPKENHKLSPNERSLKVLLGLYDFDDPQIDPILATDEDWENQLNLSESIRRVTDSRVLNKEFHTVEGMQDFIQKISEELVFWKEKENRLPKIQQMMLSRRLEAVDGPAAKDVEWVKFEYVSRLLPRLVKAMKMRNEHLTDRLQRATLARSEWYNIYSRISNWRSLKSDLATFTVGSPAWNRANSELKKLGDMGDMALLEEAHTKAHDDEYNALKALSGGYILV